MNLFADTSVAIFAGGKSRRFGSPKINAKIDDEEFGSLIINTLKLVGFSNIAMIGGDIEDARRWEVDFLDDVYPDSGPLGALLTAMRACRSDLLMTLPCDVPFIDEDTCLQLCNVVNDVDVRVARTDTPQWLCSTWRRSACDVVENEFKSGERAIHRVIEKMRFEYFDVSSQNLLNVNEPQQLNHRHKTT